VQVGRYGVHKTMITLTREEAQQVLEHLDDLADAQQWEIDMHATQYGEGYKPHRMKHMKQQLANTNSTIETLRARLAQPEPEPVAWYLPSDEGFDSLFRDHRTVVTCTGNKWEGWQPLYTAPPQREWQGLTDEEYEAMAEQYVTNCYFDTLKYARAIEAKLKEKNNG